MNFALCRSNTRPHRSNSNSRLLLIIVHQYSDIDLLHYFCGPTTRINAEKSITRRKHQGQDPNDQAEEGVALTLRFASGVVGTFLLSDTVASPYNSESATGDDPTLPQTWFNESERQEVDIYRFFGTEGTLSVPDMNLVSSIGLQHSAVNVLIIFNNRSGPLVARKRAGKQC